MLSFVPNYEPDAQGYPVNPDPSRKLLLGWAAAPDHNENWVSNRLMQDAAVVRPGTPAAAAVANGARDGSGPDSDNRTVDEGTHRILRGGAFDYSPRQARAAYRYAVGASIVEGTFGFRVVRTIPPTEKRKP